MQLKFSYITTNTPPGPGWSFTCISNVQVVKFWSLPFLFCSQYITCFTVELQVVDHYPTTQELQKSKINGESLPHMPVIIHSHMQKTSDTITRLIEEQQDRISVVHFDSVNTLGRCSSITKLWVILKKNNFAKLFHFLRVIISHVCKDFNSIATHG